MTMIAYALYNKNTLAERKVADLVKRLNDLQVQTELLDADSSRGIQLAEHYDIMGRPALLLLRTDGSPLQLWQGEDSMPSPDEVAYLAHQ